MLSRKHISTIFSKSSILVVNFALVIFTTQIWGSEGRGEIALIMANIALITILNNIFSGSTITYHTTKINKFELISISFLGSLFFSLLGSIILSLYFGFEIFKHLFVIALLSSFSNIFSLYHLGKNNIRWFNILNVLNPLLVIIFLAILFYGFKIASINAFFYAYYIAFSITFLIGFSTIINIKSVKIPILKKSSFKYIFRYGFDNELSNFFQFLNYRLSYFFIAEMLGYRELGIFSVAVSIAEALWIISRSMSVIHFSEVVNSQDPIKDIFLTSRFAKQNFWFGIVLTFIIIMTPNSLFTFVFGSNFTEVKTITLYLIPGIISIAVSNLYGHYFAGIGKMEILKNKSFLGFIATLIGAILLIPKYKLLGACISLNISFIISSLYLYLMFRKHKSTQNISNPI